MEENGELKQHNSVNGEEKDPFNEQKFDSIETKKADSIDKLIEIAKRRARLKGSEQRLTSIPSHTPHTPHTPHKSKNSDTSNAINSQRNEKKKNYSQHLSDSLGLLREKAIDFSLFSERNSKSSFSRTNELTWSSIMSRVISFVDSIEAIVPDLVLTSKKMEKETLVWEGNGLTSLIHMTHISIEKMVATITLAQNEMEKPKFWNGRMQKEINEANALMYSLTAISSLIEIEMLFKNKSDHKFLSGVFLKEDSSIMTVAHSNSLRNSSFSNFFESGEIGFQYPIGVSAFAKHLVEYIGIRVRKTRPASVSLPRSPSLFETISKPIPENSSETQNYAKYILDPNNHLYTHKQICEYIFGCIAESVPVTDNILEVDQSIKIDSSQSIETVNSLGNRIVIPSPGKNIVCHLFSKYNRCSSENEQKKFPLSQKLVIYFVGGEYLSNNSSVIKKVIKNWSNDFPVPIFVVQYSSPPTKPYPHPFNECYYAYAWAVTNCQMLGSLAEQVVLAGDSAGGGFALSVCLRAIKEGLRLPQGLLLMYPTLNNSPFVSASRFFGYIDPFLPFNTMQRSQESYRDSHKNYEDPYLSPIFASDDDLRKLPHIHIMVGQFDPLLDDSVLLVSRLRHKGIYPTFVIARECSHGFLGLSNVSEQYRSACQIVFQWLKRAFQMEGNQ